MANQKSLNDYLFDQLARLEAADAKQIEIESIRAANIIAVSRQILDVSRLKLDIINAGLKPSEDFKQIDAPSS